MPTKRQLSKMREAEIEYPQIRRSDDPMFNSNSSASTDGKPPVIRSVCLHLDTYVDDDNFIRCSTCDEIVDA